GGDAEESCRAVRGERNVIRLGERCDLLHLADAAGVARIGLKNVETAFVQVRDEFPNGAVAFAGSQWNGDVLLEAFEDLDVAGHGGLFEKEQVVRLEGRGQLDERGRRNGAMGVEHYGA